MVFDPEEELPRGRGAARRRRVGLVAREMSEEEREMEASAFRLKAEEEEHGLGAKGPPLRLSDGYMYRESNTEIGRAAERARVRVREFKAGDRWLAWRKTVARKAKNAERRGLRKK